MDLSPVIRLIHMSFYKKTDQNEFKRFYEKICGEVRKMENSISTQVKSPSPESAPQSPFFGAGAMVRGLIHLDLQLLDIDREDIARVIMRKTEKFEVVMVYDVSDDIFMLIPEQKPLSDEELEERLRKLGIKYDPEEGIVEVPEQYRVVEIFDGLGTMTLVLKEKKR